jgi:hypothetical protein
MSLLDYIGSPGYQIDLVSRSSFTRLITGLSFVYLKPGQDSRSEVNSLNRFNDYTKIYQKKRKKILPTEIKRKRSDTFETCTRPQSPVAQITGD